ncbi:MAG TPA: D-alanyl-D-alanine carboxypeptidase/D-alanyl-D-alanine-endopeptidase [Gaiellaceae bacterium]|nr:D-alanyl-D-alanine carboxypeptidase/D-alanyl-D-alanine-endopeptidase [Gaiellaceae bacterium]
MRSCAAERVLLLAVVVVAGQAAAAPAEGATLRERLDRALTARGVARSATGALAVNLRTGRTVYALHGSRSLEPASNQKLAVALAVLDRLGTDYRISTEVLGVGGRSGSEWRGRLVLKGFGDPSLARVDLRRLARRIHGLGIRKVTGRVVGDESYYDVRRTCPGWKPAWYKVESPPLSALVVARAKVGRRTVDDPARAAAAAFRSALEAAGVDVVGGSRVAAAPPDAVPLASVRSAPTALLVRRMNKTSDNFYAEMLVKHLGARFRGAGTTYRGSRVVRRVLGARGVPLEGVRIVDGSGLSVHDRLTTRAIGRMLTAAWRDPTLRAVWLDSLPLAGVDGTLEDRMLREPAYRTVRAKTGTTATASSLSGYAGSRYLFSILQNGRPIPWWYARRAQDRFAQILAGA